jgi:N-acetylmuramoyl-L-alanine amidase
MVFFFEFLRLSRLYLFLVLICAALFPVRAHALSVDHVRFGVHGEKTRLVLDLSAASDFRVFVLGDPYRMVIDLPDFTWQAGSLTAPSGAGIKAVRHGNLQPGISRIVFDTRQPVKISGAFILPRGDGKPDRLVIDFAPVPPSAFRREINRVFGTLTGGMPAASAQNNIHNQNNRNEVAAAFPRPTPPRQDKIPLIVIDPGHGGVDPGATGANDNFEKHVVLELARALRDKLEESGQYRVLMTREKDVFIKLGDRVKFARQHQADLFVSIHADSLERENVRGASVYTLSDTASDAQTAKLAANENRADLIAGIDLSVEDDEVANILVDLAMRDTMNQSRFFADKVVTTFLENDVGVLDTPHRYAGFAVLKAPDIPSVLIEAGFMSNRQEAEMLASPAYRNKFSTNVKKSIDGYFEQVRKNQRS